MVTSIVLTGTHKVGIDTHGKFMVDKVKVSIKDVPFVRYRFNEFNSNEYEYIEEMKKKFSYSAHMAEINLNKDTKEVINTIREMKNIVTYVYMDIEDTDVLEGISEEKLNLLIQLNGVEFDRLMLRDKSTTLDMVAATRIRKQLGSLFGVDTNDIGICSSPLSFDGTSACLTAVKARELSAKYCETTEAALPSSNHECMNCCGCIRYYVFDGDVAMPVSSKTGGSKNTKKDATNTVKKAPAKSITKWR